MTALESLSSHANRTVDWSEVSSLEAGAKEPEAGGFPSSRRWSVRHRSRPRTGVPIPAPLCRVPRLRRTDRSLHRTFPYSQAMPGLGDQIGYVIWKCSHDRPPVGLVVVRARRVFAHSAGPLKFGNPAPDGGRSLKSGHRMAAKGMEFPCDSPEATR